MNSSTKHRRSSSTRTGDLALLVRLPGIGGTGAPAAGRLRAVLAVLALAVAAFAITAAPASAATEMGTISEISYGSAKLTGTVATSGFSNPWSFEYCTQECSEPTATWSPGVSGSIFFSSGDKLIEAKIEGLKSNTKYFIRLNGNGTIAPPAPPYPSFTTLTADPPVVEATDNASEVAFTTAKATGKVNRPVKSNALTCNFEYITDAAYLANPVGERYSGATRMPCEPNPVTAVGSSTVSAKFTGLTISTTYHLRLVVSNAAGEDAKEAPSTFTTLTVDPPTIVSVDNASAVFSHSAAVSGKVKRLANADPTFDVTACRFEYVTAAAFTATGFAGATAIPCEPATPFTTPGGETSVTAAFTHLSPSTTYHFRLAAEDAAPAAATKEAATTFTTNPEVAKPTVVATDDATEIGTGGARVSGEVERPTGVDPALNVSCRFEYVTGQQFTEHGFENAGQAPCVGHNEVQSLTIAATAGHFRLTYGGQATPDIRFNAEYWEVEASLQNIGAEVSVRGGPGDGAGSTPYRITFVGGLTEKNVDQIGAERGAVDLSGTATVTTLTTGITASEILNDPPTNQPKEIGTELAGLEPATTYHLRLTAENGAGAVSKEAAGTFTTLPLIQPSLTFESVTGVGYTSFTATGTADPGTQGVDPMFQYSPAGKEEWIGNQLGRFLPAFVGQPPVQVSYTFPCSEGFCETEPLKPGTTYQARLIGRDEADFSFLSSPEPYVEFTTKGTSTPPSATFSVSNITGTSADFSSTVDTHAPAGPLSAEAKAAYKTDWHFECTPECPASGALSGTVTADEGSQAITNTFQLHAHTYYEVKLIAHNGVETVETPVQIVETPLIKPSVEPTPGGSDGEGGYLLEGIVNSNNSKITDCHFEYGTTSTYPNTYNAPCLPNPSGPNEVQQVSVDAGEGQFKLSFRGQTTADIAYNATPAAVQAALRALPKIGPSGVNVAGTPQAYEVTFAGALAGTNVEPLGFSNDTLGGGGGGGVSVSTTTEGGTNHQVSIEAHLENLTVGSIYHFRIFATNAAGTESTSDHTFIPTLAVKGPACPNEQLRKENLSLGLPECRAYEMVSYPNKEGQRALIADFHGGEAVTYSSTAPNLAGSGEGSFTGQAYAARRTPTGWETIPNLNGPTGSMQSGPEHAEVQFSDANEGGALVHSADLLSTVWPLSVNGGTPGLYLRRPNGRFELIAPGNPSSTGVDRILASGDLSHLVLSASLDIATFWGPGVYEFVGTGNDQPRRVDVDNAGNPLSSCGDSFLRSVSSDGSVIVSSIAGGCGGANPPANELWARVDGTTSFDVSASQCTRADCNAPAPVNFQGAAKDGSRVYFTTTQQLVNGDTNQTLDLYACDIPLGVVTPSGTAANACSSFTEVSGSSPEAEVEQVDAFGTVYPTAVVSDDGSTVYFAAKGVLAGNEDGLGEVAVAGDRNLYVWRTDAAHPTGQTTFIAKLPKAESQVGSGEPLTAETTPDGRFLVLQTDGKLVSTDTDNSTDIYRYDAVTGELVRVSTGVSGAGGNGEFDATLATTSFGQEAGSAHTPLNSHPAISDNGQLIVFTTKEALSPLDGNGESDAYLWNDGRALGSVGEAGLAYIDGSGEDIYLQTSARLNPTDIDNSTDVYDARIDGGFPQQQEGCAGEACQPEQTQLPAPKSVASQGTGPGNPASPKVCPEGKVKKHGKCVKKAKKHHKKAHHKKAHHKKAHKAKPAGKSRGGAK